LGKTDHHRRHERRGTAARFDHFPWPRINP
jgi:hypothetical protein